MKRKEININEQWYFKKWPGHPIDVFAATNESGERVNLPHTWYKDGEHYQGTAVYTKVFDRSVLTAPKAYIRFAAVDKACCVFLNGKIIGRHNGGYSAFAVPLISEYLTEDENILTVNVNNETGERISPLMGDFTVFGGICRDVTLILTDSVHFDPLFWGTNGLIVRTAANTKGAGTLYLEPHIQGFDDALDTITYTLMDYEDRIVWCQENAGDHNVSISLDNVHLWNGKSDPYLYTIKAILKRDGLPVDEVRQTCGFRQIRLDADKGFLFNGRSVRLKGVAKHQDFAEVYSAATADHWQKDFQLINEIGANAVRLSHYQHPEQVYNLCDQSGLIVWAEIPMLKMMNNRDLLDNARQQLKELVLQNIHHPSICFWGIQNEIGMFPEEDYMYEELKQMHELVKQLDPDRWTAAANLYDVKPESRLNQLTDAVGYNLYFGWYYGEMQDYDAFLEKLHQQCPNVPLGISEYGVDCNLAFHSEKPSVKDYSEEFQAQFHETVYSIFESKPYLWGSFVWNMFDFSSSVRDEGGTKYRNCKGLVTYDRQIKKDAFYYYKSQWSNEPFVHISQRRFEKRTKDVIDIKVYSNQPQVCLQANGSSWVKTSSTGVFVFEKIPLKMGENEVCAIAVGGIDNVTFIRTEQEETSYKYVDPNPGLNVRNWFMDEVEKASLFPEGYYSIMDPVDELVNCSETIAVIEDFLPELADSIKARTGRLPLSQVFNYMKGKFKEEDIKELNNRLINIMKQ